MEDIMDATFKETISVKLGIIEDRLFRMKISSLAEDKDLNVKTKYDLPVPGRFQFALRMFY